MAESKKRIVAFVEYVSESTTACLVMMAQGNVLALTASHLLIASQTGVIAGFIASLAMLAARTRTRDPRGLSRRGERSRPAPTVVQRADPQLHDDHPSPRSARRARKPVELEDPRQRIHRRARLFAWANRHQPTVRGAASEEQHHRSGPGRRRR